MEVITTCRSCSGRSCGSCGRRVPPDNGWEWGPASAFAVIVLVLGAIASPFIFLARAIGPEGIVPGSIAFGVLVIIIGLVLLANRTQRDGKVTGGRKFVKPDKNAIY